MTYPNPFEAEVAVHSARLAAERPGNEPVKEPVNQPVTPAEERTEDVPGPRVEFAAEVTYLDGTVRHAPASDRKHADLIAEGINVHVASLNEPTRRMNGVARATVVHRLRRPPWPWKPASEALDAPITPAEERTGVGDVQHAVAEEVAGLRVDLAPVREMAWTERHNGIGPTLMTAIDARLDRIEQWTRGQS